MKSLVLFLFVIGIVLLTTGYQKKMLKENLTNTEKVVEYRFIPRSIYDDQLGSPTTTASFEDMFQRQNIFTSNYGV